MAPHLIPLGAFSVLMVIMVTCPAERARELLEYKGLARSRELEWVGLSRPQIQRFVQWDLL